MRQNLKAETESETMELLTDLYFSDLFYFTPACSPVFHVKPRPTCPGVTLLTVGYPSPPSISNQDDAASLMEGVLPLRFPPPR